jgi:hypothetical protein
VRETAVLLLGGVVFDLLALGLFAAVHLIAPSFTPDVGRLVRDRAYLMSEYDAVILWTIGLVFIATAAATVAGLMGEIPIPAVRNTVDRFRTIKHESAWHKMFLDQLYKFRKQYPQTKLYCGCYLDDKSWIGGHVFSFNEDVEDVENRDLILTGDITIRSPEDPKERVLQDIGAVIVSARRIQYIEVQYRAGLAAPSK